MKKLIMISLAVIIALGMSISAFAATGSFVASPSKNQAPILSDVKTEAEGSTIKLVISSYADRDQLSAEDRTNIETAYAKIMGAKNLGELNTSITAVATKLGVDIADLAVSDLFDISIAEVEGNPGKITVMLKAETLKNFACLLHYHNGEWVVVEDAKVSEDGEHLEFSTNDFSPFAIVVNTGTPVTQQPVAEEGTNAVLVVTISAATAVLVLGVPMAYFMVEFKKKKINLTK